MQVADKVQPLLKGSAGEQQRRQDILAALLRAFAQGGPDAVDAELTRRLGEQEKQFDQRLKALEAKL